jgi:hypothetical protein
MLGFVGLYLKPIDIIARHQAGGQAIREGVKDRV